MVGRSFVVRAIQLSKSVRSMPWSATDARPDGVRCHPRGEPTVRRDSTRIHGRESPRDAPQLRAALRHQVRHGVGVDADGVCARYGPAGRATARLRSHGEHSVM